jgi:hypothetical protein
LQRPLQSAVHEPRHQGKPLLAGLGTLLLYEPSDERGGNIVIRAEGEVLAPGAEVLIEPAKGRRCILRHLRPQFGNTADELGSESHDLWLSKLSWQMVLELGRGLFCGDCGRFDSRQEPLQETPGPLPSIVREDTQRQAALAPHRV